MRSPLHDLISGEIRPPLSEIIIAAGGLIAAMVRIRESDIEKAIEDAKRRVGIELAQLLTAPTMSQEEMDAAEPEEDDVKREA